MARAVITINDACDPCWNKGETARESAVEITLDGKTWFFCEEHEKGLAEQLIGLLGDPTEGEGK